MNKEEARIANLEIAKEMLAKGMEDVWAKKAGQVIAVKAKEGDTLTTYTSDGNVEVAEEVAHEGQYILTRADENGKPLLDEYGHTNQWFMDGDKFAKRYNEPDENGIATPAGLPQHFVKTDRDVTFMKEWGKDGSLVPQDIKAGGYVNFTSENDVYGVAFDEFQETYKVIPAKDIVIENANDKASKRQTNSFKALSDAADKRPGKPAKTNTAPDRGYGYTD